MPYLKMQVNDSTIDNILAHTPKGAHTFLCDLANRYNFQLNTSKSRVTKHGDYRAPFGEFGHRISINENLNVYSFLLTLIHEISHLIVWERHKRKVKPHGTEWKSVFRNQMEIIYALKVFPPELTEVIKVNMRNPKATAHTDKNLAIALRNYDLKTNSVFLDELDYDTLFIISKGRTFLKGKKLRKRYQCKEIKSGKSYLFSPLAEVTPA